MYFVLRIKLKYIYAHVALNLCHHALLGIFACPALQGFC